jgi:hypothetical protein
MHRLSIPPRDRYTELMAQVHSLENKAWSVSVSDSSATKISCVTASGEKKKFGGVVLRKYGVRVK